jgi:5-methylcytosine-specific restriction endonuclease McrA
MFSSLHEKALAAAKRFKSAEAELIELLQKIDSCRGFCELGYPSLFVYVNKGLGLSEACTYQLITVSRKVREVPELQVAIAQGEITVAKAKSMISVIDSQNKEHWLSLARQSSTRELEKAVAAVKPENAKPEKFRHQGNNQARLELNVDEETLEALKRAQQLLAQKHGRPVSLAEALKALSIEYVRREDPVQKADRAAARTLHVKRATASRQEVWRRDRGSCQYRLPDGSLCGARQWLHLHHRKPRSEGGGDSAKNLTTLCSAHHRMAHQGH